MGFKIDHRNKKSNYVTCIYMHFKKNTILFIVALFIVIMGTFFAIERNSPLRGSSVKEVEGEHNVRNCSKRGISTGAHRSPVWTNSQFEGNFCREITGDVRNFKVTIDAKKGGFDTAIQKRNPAIRVDDVGSQTRISSKIDVRLKGSGRWWVGPKFPIKENIRQGLSGNYENYVIENASRSPQEYHKDLTRRGTYLGQTNHDGSQYKHYYKDHKSWGQFFAIRQNYRSSGSVSIKPIINMWRKNGLPNEYMNFVRVNLETGGQVEGRVEMSKINIPTWSKP